MTTIDTLMQVVRSDINRVEEMLFATIASKVTVLHDICAHILGSGGKRLRPLMLLLTARFCGYRGEEHIPLACVLEYIHTATLLHDDVIDHAEVRRGRSPAHVLWGNQATILAGDFLLSQAFALAVKVHNMDVLNVIAATSICLTEAETYQVAKTGDPMTTEDDYFFIVRNKTASLIAAASRIGAILSGMPPDAERALERYGLHVGIAFQIMDDVLDYASNEKQFGKTICKDLQEGSITLPFIAALRNSPPEDRESMIRMLKAKNYTPEDIAHIAQLVHEHGGTAYARAQAQTHIRTAIDSLDHFEDTPQRQWLIDLAHYVGERTF
ncbi:MAG: polyprenyl synthetase family protein [Desulfobacterota bacterium]|nr:polyprenyl synthetase family protein [Thermodesulfobacteriota bacterium]